VDQIESRAVTVLTCWGALGFAYGRRQAAENLNHD
jgi:hypothetical protein